VQPLCHPWPPDASLRHKPELRTARLGVGADAVAGGAERGVGGVEPAPRWPSTGAAKGQHVAVGSRVSLLTDLDAFSTEHMRCGDLDGGVDADIVWRRATAGPGWPRRVARARHLRPPAEPPYCPGMNRRRFLLTEVIRTPPAPGKGVMPKSNGELV
jgi:hypothetical protein